MRLKMHENSLFAILLRSPWWVSLVVAGALFAGARMLVPWAYAAIVALPFTVIAAVAGWRQLRAPSRSEVERRLEAARALDLKAFTAKLEAAFRAQGYEVTRAAGDAADLQLEKSGQLVLVSCRRWKAARTGVEPLRQLKEAARARRADCIYVTATGLTEGAGSFAAANGIRVLAADELANLL